MVMNSVYCPHDISHNTPEVILMAKQGMKRPEFERKKNEVRPVPEISGKAKHGHNRAAPLIAGENGKVWHSGSHAEDDLAIENMMNDFDMTAADIQDFGRQDEIGLAE